CAYILAKGRPALPQKPLPDVLGWKYSGNRHQPDGKARYQPATTD
ncbi:hypothetical protein ECP03048161_5430, partial [Escherichia coli P0304816.1]